MLDLNHPSVDRHVYTCLLDLIQKKASNIVHWWAALFFLGRQAHMCAFILCISRGSVWSTFKHSGSDGIHTIARYLVRPSFKSPQNPAWNATPFLQRHELHCDLSLFQCIHPILGILLASWFFLAIDALAWSVVWVVCGFEITRQNVPVNNLFWFSLAAFQCKFFVEKCRKVESETIFESKGHKGHEWVKPSR